jgi:ferredoxin/flavodoxin
MNNIIFCFSGTGNSLVVARDIAERLGDTKIVLIADAMKEERIDLPYERVGFVCPAYFGSLPPIIGRFAAKLDLSKAQYVFAVITAGAIHGGSFDSLGRLIAERGGCLNAGFPVQMPGNYIAMYGAWPARLQRFLYKKTKKKTAKIAQSIKEKRTNRSCEENTKTSKPLTDRMSGYEKFAKDYRVTEKCTGCETCVKICPMRNITMVDGKPQFGENCERCMACIQWCPVKAIEYKNITAKRKQYRHPDVKSSDLFPKP